MTAALPAILAGARGVIVGVSGERSIGHACARTMVGLGAEVAVTSRPGRRPAVAPLAAALDALHLDLDVDDPASVVDAFAALDRRFGRLDFVVHTLVHVPAGLLERPLTELDSAGFGLVLAIGVHSLVVLCKHARPLLMRSSAPRVVAIGSPCGHRMTPHYHVAGIAKAALESTVLYLAHELGPLGILCNTVSPGLIDTDGAIAAVGADAAASTRAHMARRAATRRPTELDDVARCVAWLSSPFAGHITGEVVTVDGGHARGYF